MKVLVVDDNSQARQLIKDFVLTEDDEFRECEDGAEALAAYTEFQPDWVLMDWDMKKVDGLIATKNIIAEFPDAKIVMVTNYDEPDLRQAAKEAGAIGYIRKENILEITEILS
ncbi:MAG TPA: response regulator transcription factor [Pyrinomonadaceae bacterium]|nr:response regulator transcription factor [Pyrinomonadaceae bacterium]